MSQQKMNDARKKTIVFARSSEFELEFAEWYDMKSDDFNTEADALAQWAAMCDNADKQEPIEDDNDFGWREVEERCDEIQEEYSVANYDEKMTEVIDEVVVLFKEIGVEFHKDWSCCNTCGHAEAQSTNYVFYHAQDNERLRKGERSVHLAHRFDEETKQKVLEMIEKQTCDDIKLHWSGDDGTRIFLTCDDDEMAKHIKEITDRDVRLAEKKKAEEKAARRAELVKQLAELDK
jgi:hypothetical protein